MGDVLQEQLSPLAVLVEFLEEHSRLEIPSGETQEWSPKPEKPFLGQAGSAGHSQAWCPPAHPLVDVLWAHSHACSSYVPGL